MAEAAGDPGVVSADAASVINTTEEDIQNLENENSENALVENDHDGDGGGGGGSDEAMEVDSTVEGKDMETVDPASSTEIQPDKSEVKKEEPVTDEKEITPQETSTSTTENNSESQKETDSVPVDPVKTDDGETPPESKEEVKEAAIENEASAEVSIACTDANVPVKTDTKEESMGEEGDAYMVLEEADGDENDSETSDDQELTENERLRKANLELSNRLALLEEFIEVEFSDKFGRFMQKRAHLVDVMGINKKNSDDVKANGKRNAKSLELVGLLKIVNDQSRNTNGSPRKYNNRSTNRSPRGNRGTNSTNSNTPAPKTSSSTSAKPKPKVSNKTATTSVSVPPNKKEEAASTNAGDSKRCHRCRKPGHIMRDCPYPHENMNRRVILKRENRDRDVWKDSRKQRISVWEDSRQNPSTKTIPDKRRRLTWVLNN